VFVKLLLLLLWFGKELDLVAHNKDIALQQTLGKLLSISLLTIQRHPKYIQKNAIPFWGLPQMQSLS